MAAEDRFIDAPVGVPVHFVKDSRKCQRLGSGLSASNVDPVPSSQRHAILSIVETCRSLKIPVRDYLAAVLPGTGHVGSCGPVVVFTAIPEKSDLCPSRPKVIPRIGLKSEDGVEGQNDETCDLWLLGCPRACDIQNLNRGLRQPIFEPLSDVLIAGRQMNPRLVMLLRELGRFSSIRPSYSLAFVNYRIIESR